MAEKYEHQRFPRYKYHPEKEPVVVHTQEAEDDLGGEWLDAPAETSKAVSEGDFNVVQSRFDAEHKPSESNPRKRR